MRHLISSMSDGSLITEIYFNGVGYDFQAISVGHGADPRVSENEVIAKIENITLSEAIKQTTLSWVAELECCGNPYAEAKLLQVPML